MEAEDAMLLISVISMRSVVFEANVAGGETKIILSEQNGELEAPMHPTLVVCVK